jgi:hypothetical protein
MKTLALVLTLLLTTLALAGEEAIGPNTLISWDPVTTDITGAPTVISSYEIAAFPLGTNLVTTPATAPLSKARIEAAQVQTQASAFILSMANAQKIVIAVRAVDLAGNVSVWSNTIDGKLFLNPPNAPGNLKKLWPVAAGAAVLVALAILRRRRKS